MGLSDLRTKVKNRSIYIIKVKAQKNNQRVPQVWKYTFPPVRGIIG
jgi:hypothetical protein